MAEPTNFQVPSPQFAVSQTLGTDQTHKVAYTQYGDLNNSKNAIIITVHGLTGDHYQFHYFSEYAKSQGLCTINIDIIGRGSSDDLADPKQYTYEQYAADIVAVCNTVYKRQQLELATLQPDATIDQKVDAKAISKGSEDGNVVAVSSSNNKTNWYYIGTSMGGILGMILCGGMLKKYPFLGGNFEKIVLNDIGPSVSVAGVNAICAYVSVPTYFSSRDQAADYFTKLYSATFGPFVDRDFFLHRAMVALREDPDDPTRFIVRYHRVGVLNGVKDETLPDLQVYKLPLDEEQYNSYETHDLVSLDDIPEQLAAGNTLYYSFWNYFKALDVPMMLYHGLNSTLITSSQVQQMKHCYAKNIKKQFEYVPWDNTGHVPPLYKEIEFTPILTFFDISFPRMNKMA